MACRGTRKRDKEKEEEDEEEEDEEKEGHETNFQLGWRPCGG